MEDGPPKSCLTPSVINITVLKMRFLMFPRCDGEMQRCNPVRALISTRALTQHALTIPRTKQSSYLHSFPDHRPSRTTHHVHRTTSSGRFAGEVTQSAAQSTRASRPPTSIDLLKTDKIQNVAGSQSRPLGPMIWASSLFGFCLSIYLSYLYVSATRVNQQYATLDLPQNADVSDRWKDATRDFDDEVNASESLMWVRAKRKRMVNEAYGNVLEVSVGTGRNMRLYDLRPYGEGEGDEGFGRSGMRRIRSLTFCDQSGVMVGKAKRKFEVMQMESKKWDRFMGDVRYIVGDAGGEGVIPRPEGGYDTIVQTMGVCSMVDAPGFLRRLGELCRRPGEASQYGEVEGDDGGGGKIMLLEHGRGYYGWLNRYLDRGAKGHAAHYGCWWNKDVEQIVKESGLKIERMRRSNLGTTWEIVLRPAK